MANWINFTPKSIGQAKRYGQDSTNRKVVPPPASFKRLLGGTRRPLAIRLGAQDAAQPGQEPIGIRRTEQETVTGSCGNVDRPRAVGQIQQRFLAVAQTEPPSLIARQCSSQAARLRPQLLLPPEINAPRQVQTELGPGHQVPVQIPLQTEAIGPDFEARCVGTSRGRNEERHATEEDDDDRNEKP